MKRFADSAADEKYAFRHDSEAFILKAEDGSKVRVGPRHEKYDYVQGVEAGRVIGISKSGRWTNAKDYDELYDKVSFGKSKPAARTKPKAAKANCFSSFLEMQSRSLGCDRGSRQGQGDVHDQTGIPRIGS